MYFRINTPRIVHETIDDETIMIDFDSGSYFTTRGIGAYVWSLMDPHGDPDQIVDRIVAQYGNDPRSVEAATRRFVADLEREELIIREDGEGSLPIPELLTGESTMTVEKRPFSGFVLEKYTDMQELLLLDPIHEVDRAGWPLRKHEA